MNTKLLNNRYQVIEVLGAGGFGETFLAEDTYMPSRRRCVIKQLKTITGDPRTYDKIKQRFEREAATLEFLGEGSDQIPKLYAYFSEQGLFYLVQEWIQGPTLTQIIETRGVLSETDVREVLLNLLTVLDYVHSKGIIHRDIKPDNVILSASSGKPVLIDFGAVKETIRTIANPPGRFTESLIIGTPGYMPSEQAIGRPIYATDIYSLGLTAIFLLTGKAPQELQTNRQTGEIHWEEYAPDVSHELVEILNTAIKLQAGERFTTASKMLYALKSEGTIPPSPIAGKSQPLTQRTVAVSPNAGRFNQPIQKSSSNSNSSNSNSSNFKTDVVGASPSNIPSTVWQRPPVIIGSLILGSLIGGIAISSFAISGFERQSQREEKLTNSAVVDPTTKASPVNPLDKDFQEKSSPSPSPDTEAENNSVTSSPSPVDNSSVNTPPVVTEDEVPEQTQQDSENTESEIPEENTIQESENTESEIPTNTSRERENPQGADTFTPPQQEEFPNTPPERKSDLPEVPPPEDKKSVEDDNNNPENNNAGVPAFPVGTAKDTIKAALGEPNSDRRGAHGNTRAHLYKRPNKVDLGYIIDKNSGILRQTEVSFNQSTGKDVIQKTLQGMMGGNVSNDIKQELEKVYQRRKRKHCFRINGLKGVIERNRQDRIYIGVWDSKLHSGGGC